MMAAMAGGDRTALRGFVPAADDSVPNGGEEVLR